MVLVEHGLLAQRIDVVYRQAARTEEKLERDWRIELYFQDLSNSEQSPNMEWL